MLKGKFLAWEGQTLVVEEVYGHKLLCHPIDPEDGCCLEDVVVIETCHGMMLLDCDPMATPLTEDEQEPTGPTAREFLFAIQKLEDNGEVNINHYDIAGYLGYDYDPVQKRAARLVREIPDGFLKVSRAKGRRGNTYSIQSPVAVSRWLKNGLSD